MDVGFLLSRLTKVLQKSAADGLTEANLYLLPKGADANESLPAYHMSTLTLIELAWTFFLIILDITPKGGKNATFREITRKVAFFCYSGG